MESRPFTIHVTDEAIEDLHRRLRDGRWPVSIDANSWEDGTSLSFLKRLRDHWLHRFDWRMQECRLNQLPQYVSTIRGLDIHFVHQPGWALRPCHSS
jgi:hypothetical protein